VDGTQGSRGPLRQAAVGVYCRHHVTPGWDAMVSSAAACSVRRTGTCLTMHCQWGCLSSFSFFVPDNLNLRRLTLTYELRRDFCTVHLTAKFHHPTFNRSEVIVRTNRQQTPLKTSTSLRYTTPTGNKQLTNTVESESTVVLANSYFAIPVYREN